MRPVALAGFLGLLLATLHPYKEPRFLVTAVPFLLLVATLTFAHLAHTVPRQGRLIGGLLCAAALVATVGTAARSQLDARLAGDYRFYSTPPALWKPLLFLSRQAPHVPRVAVIGTFNELSDSLVRWRLAQGSREVVVVSPPRPAAASEPGRRHWLAAERPDCILALRLRPESPLYGVDYQRYNAWQLELIDHLEREEGWQERKRRAFGALGMEVVVLAPAGKD